MIKYILGMVAIFGCLMVYTAEASAMSDFIAQIKISGGGTYDYCVIGMDKNATDGFDNAYDSFAPGWNMNDTYIACVIPHPEWNTIKTDFRGDIRATKPVDTWNIVINTNLPAGTPLTMEALENGTPLPQKLAITAADASGKRTELTAGSYAFTSTGASMGFAISARFKKVKDDKADAATGEHGKDRKK